MLTPEGSQPNHEAHRGIIVRQFQARLNGTETSDFTFSIMRHTLGSVPRLILEIGLPFWFLDGLAKGTAQFRKGDFIRGDIENMLPPREIDVYYGNSDRLQQWYSVADVALGYSNAWKILAWEAQRADQLQVDVLEGTLERKYPPRIDVSSGNVARFDLKMIANDWPGVVPISISGVQQGTFALAANTIGSTHRLYRWSRSVGAWETFGLGSDGSGEFQLDREIADGTFTFTYNLGLELDDVQSCESFAFGPSPPSTPGGACLLL